jgi:hypothetical protein
VNDEDAADEEQDDIELIAIRHAFYEGVGRRCTKAAWSAIDGFRQEQHGFLGKSLSKPGISQQKIATAIDRSAGEICRWLQGKSPNWTNLMVVMLALNANWRDLRSLPEKRERKFGGYSQALFAIRRRVLGDDTKELIPPADAELRGLEALFTHKQWAVARRLVPRRSKLLTAIGEENHLDASFLDRTDQFWGRAFLILQRAYMESIDVAIWR